MKSNRRLEYSKSSILVLNDGDMKGMKMKLSAGNLGRVIMKRGGMAAIGFWLFLTGFGISDPSVHGINRYSRISLLFHDIGVYGWRSEFIISLLFLVSLLAAVWVSKVSKLSELSVRMRRHIRIISVVYALMLVVGNVIEKSEYFLAGPFRPLLFLASLVKWYGLYFLLARLISVLYRFWIRKETTVLASPQVENTPRSLRLYWGIILLAWLPYILLNCPGIVTVDGFWQLSQVMGEVPVTDHHPVLHTGLLWVVYKIASLFPGTNTVTVFLYVIVQSVILSGIYAYSIKWLGSWGIRSRIQLIVLAFYALLPLHGYNATFLSKDFLSAGFLLLAFLFIIDLMKGDLGSGAFLRGVAVLIIAGLLRNNVLYAVVFTLVVLIVWFQGEDQKKRVFRSVAFILAAVLLLSKGSILSNAGIPESPSTESLSIPIQQIARALTSKDEIPQEISADVEQFFTLDELKDLYDPYISDPVKFTIANSGGDISSVMKIWTYLLKDNFPVYVDSFLLSTYGFWYPQINFSSVFFPADPGEYAAHGIRVPFEHKGAYVTAAVAQAFQFIPGVNLLSGIGFMALLLFLSADVILAGGREKKHLVPYIPLIITYLTLLVATPMSGVPRYAHFLYAAMPVYVLLPFLVKEQKGEGSADNALPDQSKLV